MSYFVDQLAQAYARFEQRTADSRSTGTKQDRVRGYVLDEAATIFRISDVRHALPGVSDQTIRLVLETLKKDGLLVADGTGRGATWRLTGPGDHTEARGRPGALTCHGFVATLPRLGS